MTSPADLLRRLAGTTDGAQLSADDWGRLAEVVGRYLYESADAARS